MDAPRKQLLFITGGLGATLGTIWLAKHFWQKYQYWNSPLVKAGNVKELWIFPLKSGKGIQVDWLDCEIHGPTHNELQDRYFMLVDAKQNYLAQNARQYPKMILLETNVKNGVLTISAPNRSSISVDLKEVVQKNVVVRGTLYGKKEDALDCGDAAGQFLNEYLNVVDKRDIRLLYFVEGLYTERNKVTQSNFWNNPVPELTDYATFQNQSTYHVLAQSSVDELNSHLEKLEPPKIVTGQNFRPNILFVGAPAFDEDKWLDVHIGDAEFLCYKPAPRCPVPNVDPNTGESDIHIQPLKMLREYRLAPEGKMRDFYENNPVFGVYMKMIKPGRIRVNDSIFVRYKPTPF